jgi:hypothetical protein
VDLTKSLRIASIVAALAASTACSSGEGGSPSAPSLGGSSSFRVTVVPSPVTAERCNPGCASETGGTGFAFKARMTINVSESSGSGADMTTMTLTASADGVTFSPLVFSSSDITDHAGSNHINANGSLSVPFTIVYNTPSGAANLSVSISVELARGANRSTVTGNVNVI